MRFNNKFNARFLDPFRQRMELLHRKRQPGMRHGNLVPIHRVVVVHASIIVPDPVAYDLMTVQGVILPFFGGSALLTAEDGAVELFGFVE
mmetsp:Transcript_2475/g.3789  ORF Transcript_2475/g.3789 Transcript_2475/m.3789 type:complete len:90 (+) Transcript_2475:134-403(+)